MRKGDTAITETCQYLVRRPTEIFLSEGEPIPQASNNGDLSQELLLKQPSYIEHRNKKDPREIKIIDPACGSGHFLLYCFDLLITIYEEAYDDTDLGAALKQDYPTLAELRRDIPGLILTRNLYGIDIDLRATQIAALVLWLRAQRAYHETGLARGERPPIARTNIVCAEPMPGERELLDEFTASLEPRVLGQLVRVVFERMKLAGEAGALLKIEREIRGTITEAKEQWQREYERAIDKRGEKLLFSKAEMDRLSGKGVHQQGLFDVSEITDEQFWGEAEHRVLESLKRYSQMASNGNGLLRQLFADDTATGFAFVDICQKRFDVVLMNPPFGTSSKNAKQYIADTYPDTEGDLLANFIERALDICLHDGIVGAISSRTCFFLGSFASLREKVLKDKAFLSFLADLGDGVLEAVVETAAYILTHKSHLKNSIFFRALLSTNKASCLLEQIESVSRSDPNEDIFVMNTDSFSSLTGAPYAYWISADIINRLTIPPRLEGSVGKVRVGLQTSGDARFLRLIWEVPPSAIGQTAKLFKEAPDAFVHDLRMSFRDGKRWAFYSKTNFASPWISPLTLVVDWERDGDSLKELLRQLGQSPSRTIRSEDLYFQPGFSYLLRSTRLVPYIVPAGVIPTAGRAQVYPASGNEFALLGFCASNIASAVARFSGEKFAWPKFQASMVQNLPVPVFSYNFVEELTDRIETEVKRRRSVIQGHEPFQEFTRPAILDSQEEPSTAWKLLSLLGSEMEAKVAEAFNLSAFHLAELERDIREAVAVRDTTRNDGEDEEAADHDEDSITVELVDENPRSLVEGLMSYSVGVVLGRWDVRMAIERALAPELQDVFAPLPVCPPGTLVGPDGSPASSGNIVSEEWLRSRPNAISLPLTGSVTRKTISDSEYPVRVDWDGILVDDPEHKDDILRRVRDVFSVIWMNEADRIEQQTCQALSLKHLRDYFRKPGKDGFWADHVKRYSKSRRKAPIYWLLQSSKKNYAIWLYYHRLDKDMLYKVLINYVEPKIRLEENNLNQVRSRRAAGTGGREAKQLERQIDQQESFISELRDFRDKLRRAADLQLEPDLNDGVILNIAPLWEIVPWAEVKKYWQELLEGKYEWSTIGKQLRERGIVTA
jgi:hypothetical protein